MKKVKSMILKKLDLKSDITKKYQDWMNDLEVTKFTEQKYKKHTLKDIRNFVREKNNSKNEFLYGIFVKINNLNTHVGFKENRALIFDSKISHASTQFEKNCGSRYVMANFFKNGDKK